jgi:hypothetical protein
MDVNLRARDWDSNQRERKAMATMVETATSSEIQSRINEATRKVRESEQALEAILHEISGIEDVLTELQSERQQECVAVAVGNSRANPARFDQRIAAARDRLTGLEALKRRKEIGVADAKVVLHDLHVELSKAEQEKATRVDADNTRRLIGEVETAIEDRNRAQRIIQDGVQTLRARKYLSENTRRMGLDSAERLERRAVGLRN